VIGLAPRQLRQAAGRTARLLPYWSKVAARAPLDQQVMALHRRVLPREFWIELASITLAGDVREWRLPHHGFAIDGDWDLGQIGPRPSILEPAHDGTVKSMTHATIRAMFIEGVPYQATPQYEAMIEAVERKDAQRAYGCESVEEVDEYFQRLLSAHRGMSADGFRTQRELGLPPWDEVKVYITRDGRLCHGNGGNHRIRIAELLGVKSIPVIFAGAHRDWLVGLCQQQDRPPRSALRQWVGAQERTGSLHRSRPSH